MQTMDIVNRLSSGPYILFQSAIFSVVTISLPQLIQRRICRDLFNATVCNGLAEERYSAEENVIQAHAAGWLTMLPTSSLILVTLTVLFVGTVGDMIGKRRAMLIVPALTLLQSIAFIAISESTSSFHPAWLFLPQLIPGIFADNQGALLLASAYRADTTRTDQRTGGISFIEGFFYSSVAIFSLLSGLLLKYLGFRAVFGLNAFVSVVSLFYVAFVLPDEWTLNTEEGEYLLQHKSPSSSQEELNESDEPRTPEGFNFGRLVKLEKIKEVLKHEVYGFNVKVYLFTLFLAVVPILGIAYVGVLYVSHSPFGLRTSQIGYLVLVTYMAEALGAWLVIPLLKRFVKANDFTLLIIGYLGMVVHFFSVGSAVNTAMLFSVQIFHLVAVIPLPVNRSLISKTVPNELHGSALALGEFSDALACIVTNFGGNLIYKHTVSIFPGIAMYCYGVVSLIGLIISIYLFRRSQDIDTK